MTTTSHRNCPHPATSSARAKCRRERAAQVDSLRHEVGEMIYSYYQGEGDAQEIIYALMKIFPEVSTAYFETDLDTEELISLARQLKNDL